ncbi:CPBP family intramembrane glutamic endopeptidase [Galactobacter caseinivorans]|uniref:CPBP family intramembrane metalloprotease n=1 Tax=Galactobacter caseinivorans TaxID=2676123 RepID=A0A496PJN7_9MICC|nr:type II CAAX endopeptidase family protein [Galactobacter caseinivorans]RKW70711.1 CPBP family intramembrane metalloprotease [Galactobacter caseinivorans]
MKQEPSPRRPSGPVPAAADGLLTGAPAAQPSRRVLIWEIVIVLALSLGRSGVNALINLIDLASRGPIGDGVASLNGSASARPWIDLAYQLSGIVFSLAPVALVIWLLARWPGGNPLRRLGLDFTRWWPDLRQGVVLFLAIGVGTLGLYAGGRALGITTAISTNGLGEYWWTIPVLILAALRNGLLEEVIVVGYLMERLERLGWRTWSILLSSALLRGSYHLYQGVGPFIGNAIMGLIFGWLYLKKRRVAPLVIAHTLLDVAGFVAYPLLASAFGYGS